MKVVSARSAGKNSNNNMSASTKKRFEKENPSSKKIHENVPLDLNEGDAELREYFDPIITEAGGNL